MTPVKESAVTREPRKQSLYEKTLACVHCGLCLPACPAYGTSPRESLAPRGQVYNIRAWLEDRVPLSTGLADEIYDCLACRGCESVCPAGVPVGSIMEDARGLITEAGVEPWWQRLAKRVLLGTVLARPRVLALAMSLMRFAEWSGLRRLGAALVGERATLFPVTPPRPAPLPESLLPEGEPKKRVALFTGCIASHLFADVNHATARVLARNGYEVVVPRAQGCCGALHLHNGLPEIGRKLARANVALFESLDVEAVIVNAAGCGAALTEYGDLLKGDEKAERFSGKVKDVAAFLVREGFDPPRASARRGPLRVAYDPPCHLFHAQGVKGEPRELLASIPGVELVDYKDAERCCGSAGIYNVTHYERSMEVLETKMRELSTTRADVVATGNPGCHMQLSEGVRRARMKAEVLHPVVLLDRAYAREA